MLEEALNRACAVPLEIMAACCEGITLAEEYGAKGSVLALSDAGCAALFCKAALQAAGLNVTVNTRLMADKARAAALNAEPPRCWPILSPKPTGSMNSSHNRRGNVMATILKGAPVVAAMNEANAARCAALKARGVTPTLAVVRVGARPDDLSYEKGVLTRCGKVGVEVKQFLLPEDAAQEQLLDVIAQVNADPAIHGCLLFRPLPKQFDDRTIRAALAPEKDIDGITDSSLAGVFTNSAIGTRPARHRRALRS